MVQRRRCGGNENQSKLSTTIFHGSITDNKVISGLPDGLTGKAIEAVKKIRFNPAVKNGAPVSVRGHLEFSFSLY